MPRGCRTDTLLCPQTLGRGKGLPPEGTGPCLAWRTCAPAAWSCASPPTPHLCSPDEVGRRRKDKDLSSCPWVVPGYPSLGPAPQARPRALVPATGSGPLAEEVLVLSERVRPLAGPRGFHFSAAGTILSSHEGGSRSEGNAGRAPTYPTSFCPRCLQGHLLGPPAWSGPVVGGPQKAWP